MNSLNEFQKTHDETLKESYNRFLDEVSEEQLKYYDISYSMYIEFIYSQYKKGLKKNNEFSCY
jgi:hypothetical protein